MSHHGPRSETSPESPEPINSSRKRTGRGPPSADITPDRGSYTGPHPEADAVLSRLYALLHTGRAPAEVLGVASDINPELARLTVLRCLTPSWAIASEKLISSLTDDQVRAVLCALLCVFQQAKQPTKGSV